MIQSKHHQGVGVGQDSLVDREPVSGLVDALIHSDRMAGRFSDDRPES